MSILCEEIFKLETLVLNTVKNEGEKCQYAKQNAFCFGSMFSFTIVV